MLALSNLGAGPSGPPHYPVPPAAVPENSFLATPEQTRGALDDAGFETLVFRDTTVATRARDAEMRRRLEAEGLPPLGLHVLMGERMRELQVNSARNMAQARLSAIEALVRSAGAVTPVARRPSKVQACWSVRR